MNQRERACVREKVCVCVREKVRVRLREGESLLGLVECVFVNIENESMTLRVGSSHSVTKFFE